MASVVDKELSAMETSKLKEIFLLFDTKGIGFITSRDLCVCFKSLGYNPTEAECQDLINEVSPDGDRCLRFPEFASMMSSNQVTGGNEEELKEVFRVFDSNGSGLIGADELKQVMENLGEGISKEEAIALIRSVNPNGQDNLDYEQFLMLIST